MKNYQSYFPNLYKHKKYAAGAIIVASVLLGYVEYKVLNTITTIRDSQRNIEQIRNDFDTRLTNLENSFARAEEENISLSDALQKERERNEEIQDHLENITDTVGVLEKLKDTDPELLQKYSKVYFLNEHYVPTDLAKIDDEYVWGNKTIEIHSDVWPFLKDLLEDAKKDGINLRVLSGYRSFGTQAGLKSKYNLTYGAGTANTFSADQGYSEHQLGTTIDFTTTELNGSLGGFNNTTAYTWLQDHADRYGFVLSYPENNQYYEFEPWHWRFVGKDLARKLDREGIYFYDYEQRRIDEYLADIFD